MALVRLAGLQVNLNKTFLATVELSTRLDESRQIAFLQEPYTAFGKVVAMPTTYKVFPGVHMEEPPRAALVIPKEYNPLPLTHLSNRDLSVASIAYRGETCVVASAYLDSTLPVVPAWLEQLVRFVEDRCCSLLLCMDTNAHSTLYGPDSNARGERLEEFLLLAGLYIENRGQVPTFDVVRNGVRIQSCIDITVTKNLPRFHNWNCLLYTSPSPRDLSTSRMPSSA